jgi:hypothetical protein
MNDDLHKVHYCEIWDYSTITKILKAFSEETKQTKKGCTKDLKQEWYQVSQQEH